jgi:hypothetical protein
LLTAPDRNELIPAILKRAKRTMQANMAGLALVSSEVPDLMAEVRCA